MVARKRGNFLNLLQEEGVPRKGGSLRKGGVPTLEETMQGKSSWEEKKKKLGKIILVKLSHLENIVRHNSFTIIFSIN